MAAVAGLFAALALWWWLPAADLARLEPPRVSPSAIRRIVAGKPGAMPLRQRGLLALATAGVAVLIFGSVGALLAVLLAPGVAVGLGYLEPASVRREREQLQRSLPQGLDLLGACLHAGLPLRRAVAEVCNVVEGPLRAELELVRQRIDVGVPEEEAWRASAQRPVIGPVMRDLARSVSSGTALVETLARHAEEARREAAGAAQEKARAVGVATVYPLMICFLPAFMLVGVIPIIASTLLAMFR